MSRHHVVRQRQLQILTQRTGIQGSIVLRDDVPGQPLINGSIFTNDHYGLVDVRMPAQGCFYFAQPTRKPRSFTAVNTAGNSSLPSRRRRPDHRCGSRAPGWRLNDRE